VDLRTFVSETLTQIAEGVADAQKRMRDSHIAAAVNPSYRMSTSQRDYADATPVEFDVAVVVSEENAEASGGKVGGSVGVIAVITAKTSAEIESKSTGTHRNETASRIRFAVQLAQPAEILRASGPSPQAKTRVV
jgi:hypothetical protein